MAKKQDQQVLDLIKKVNEQKAEISKAERPQWKTNCSFPDVTRTVNLRVENDIGVLVKAAAHIMIESDSINIAAQTLGVDYKFTFSGYSLEDWLSDMKTRISQIQINEKKKNLEKLEQRLEAIVSPELRRELELKAIEEELS